MLDGFDEAEIDRVSKAEENVALNNQRYPEISGTHIRIDIFAGIVNKGKVEKWVLRMT